MSKVLVDRELLVRLENAYMGGMSIYGECEEIRELLAQPAEAEGTELKRLAAELDAAPDDAEWEPPHPIFQMAAEIDRLNSAMSAVTAERDRLLSDNASLRGSCKALGEENKQLKRENKRQGRTIAAMAAKEA